MLSLRGFVNVQPKPCYNAGMKSKLKEWAYYAAIVAGMVVLYAVAMSGARLIDGLISPNR